MKHYRRQDYSFFSPASCSGSSFEPDYQLKVQEDGCEMPVVDGQIPLHAKIQSAAVGTTLPELIARASRGDLTAIPAYDESKLDQIADVTDQPTSLMEAQNRLIEAKKIFAKLPQDQILYYGQDPSRFLSALNDGSYAEKFIKPKRKANAEAKAAREAELAKQRETKLNQFVSMIKEELNK